MVEQMEKSKTSSRRKQRIGAICKLQCVVRAVSRVPANTKLMTQHDVFDPIGGYEISGTISEQAQISAKWKVPPHRQFANLPQAPASTSGVQREVIDPKAMLKFVNQYGFLRAKSLGGHRYMQEVKRALPATQENMEAAREVPEIMANLVEDNPQGVLQYAWTANDDFVIEQLSREAVGGLTVEVSAETGEVVITARDMWSLVCLLFLRDHAAGKTAICNNPDCPAPYFIRGRKTQKICEAGDCVSWAQRKYALKWWRENQAKGNSKTKSEVSER